MTPDLTGSIISNICPLNEIAVWIALNDCCQYDLGCCTCSWHGTDRRGAVNTNFSCGGIDSYIICCFVVVFSVLKSQRPLENCHRITIAAINSMVIVIIITYFLLVILTVNGHLQLRVELRRFCDSSDRYYRRFLYRPAWSQTNHTFLISLDRHFYEQLLYKV